MTYTVIAVPPFASELKRLAKKYPSLKDEYIELVKELKKTPEIGVPLGNNVYKIRLAIASKGKGKSGGARVITYLKTKQGNVYLLSIYDKGEKDTISDKEIKAILNVEVGD